MKKLFFVAALFVAAIANAQTYDLIALTVTDADITVVSGTKAFDEAKGYFIIKNTAGEQVQASLAQVPNVVFAYKNSQEKTGFKIYSDGRVQADGKERDVIISNLTPGTTVTLSVGSKGDTGAHFTDGKVPAFTGCVAVDPTAEGIGAALPGKTAEAEARYDIVVTALEGTITIRENAGGYVLYGIQIGTDNALENVNAEAVKAQKVIENGQLYIIKNGVKYNALGAIAQ